MALSGLIVICLGAKQNNDPFGVIKRQEAAWALGSTISAFEGQRLRTSVRARAVRLPLHSTIVTGGMVGIAALSPNRSGAVAVMVSFVC